jgi:phosphoesterase RecJ-like protein
MKDEDIQAITELLSTPKKIVIIPHRSPDGDAMGSTLGLYHFLKHLNQEPVVIAPNEFPDFLAWLPSSESVLIYEKEKEKAAEIILNADLVFTLDFNALHRTGEMEQVLKKVTAPFIMIDHHQKPDDYAKYMFSDPKYGSTCEMVYHFIVDLGSKNVIDKTVATCLYTGIVTDSGSFRFPSTTSTTHRVVADLIDIGIENGAIHNSLFDNSSYNRLQLLGQALQNMKINFDKKTSYITLSQKELDQNKYVKGDTEGIVNYGLSIKGVVFTAIFIEHRDENIIKISFRSQGDFDVNEFARTHFSGGGHINAAGGKSYLPLKDTVAKFEEILSKTTIN